MSLKSSVEYLKGRAHRFVRHVVPANECRCGFCTREDVSDDHESDCMDARVFDDIAYNMCRDCDDPTSLIGFFRIIALFYDTSTSQNCCVSILGDHGELQTYDDAVSCMKYLMCDPMSDVDAYMVSYRQNISGDMADDYGITMHSYNLGGWREIF